jgi:RNA polymerase sigma factor (TIGR02999 family)
MTEQANPDEVDSTADQILPMVYQELRQLAAARLRREPPGQTLQATALVHEVYLRLLKGSQRWESKTHFFAAAAIAMRRILVENARRKRTVKRGGQWERLELAELCLGETSDHERVVELDDALTRLAELDGLAARVAELRLFAGLTIAELSETLGIPQTSAFREWAFARAWLKTRLSDGEVSVH